MPAPSSTGSDKENSERRTRRTQSQTQTQKMSQTQSQSEHAPDELALITGLAYDPDQPKEQKRAVRRDYRAEIEEGEHERANVQNMSVDQLNERVDKNNQLFKNVKNPSEAVLDSRLLLINSELSAAKARHMKVDANAFDTDDYVQRLITLMGGRKADQADDDDDGNGAFGPLDWEIAGWRAVQRTKRVLGIDFMLGPLSVEQKKRVVQKRARLEKSNAAETRPQELTEQDIERSENETTKNVRDVWQILRKNGRINIFRLVVNPASFAQTVENIFYLSFSIRDGRVALEQDEETGEFIVYACDAPTDEDYEEELKKRQLVFEMDMETWQMAIDELGITESLIPTRADARVRLGDKWYG